MHVFETVEMCGPCGMVAINGDSSAVPDEEVDVVEAAISHLANLISMSELDLQEREDFTCDICNRRGAIYGFVQAEWNQPGVSL